MLRHGLPGSLVLALALACPASAQTYTIKTIVGGALPENVPGLSASLGGINAMAADPAGNVYLALGDYNIVVRCEAATGVVTRVAGNGIYGFGGDNGPAINAQLANPSGIALDSSGDLYIADADNNRIRLVANGNITTIAGTGVQGYSGDNGPAMNAQFNGLGALAVDAPGNLYIADFYNQVVRRISNGTIATIAGNGSYGYSGDHGPAVNAQLAGPSGIAVDYLGNLYIAEGYNNRVRKVVNGVITTIAGTGVAGYAGDYGPAGAAMLREPSDIAIDALSNAYIADYGNNRVRMISFAKSTISTFAGDGQPVYNGEHVPALGASLVAPLHVAADAGGNLYIADGSRVRKVSHNTIDTIAGGGVPAGENGPAVKAQLSSPQSIALDGAGNVYVTDVGSGRILKIAGGTLTRVAGTGTDQGSKKEGAPATSFRLSEPSGVAVNSGGDIFITDTQDCRLRKISSGVLTTIAGGGSSLGDKGPANKAQLSQPQSVAVDAGGNLFLSDLFRIRMISNGVITTVAGNGNDGYQGDGGPATAAYLANPDGVAVDNSGTLYFADYGNNRVRAVTNGIITTVAGNGNYGFTSGANASVNATSAQIGYPAGVAVDTSGNLYITDRYRVLKVSKGKVSTIAGLQNPQGIAVDPAGNLYVAEPDTHRVRLLSPSGTSCAVTVPASTPVTSAAGGTVPVSVQIAATCAWAVENLPAWIAPQGSPFGAGPGSVNLMVSPNSDAPRAATILVGGQNVVVAQAGAMTIAGQILLAGKPLPGVNIALSGSQSGMAVSDSGGNFMFSGFSSAGAYTVTPSLAGYSFVPPSLTFTNVTANPAANFTAWAIPGIGGIGPVFGSSIQPPPDGFAAGEAISIYGSDLCSNAATAAPTLPDRLSACIVQLDGANIRVWYASPSQINAVLPQTLALGAHQLTVQRYTDTGYKTMAAVSQPFNFNVNRVSMAFAEDVDGLLIQYPDGGFVSGSRPLHPGDVVVLYLTGLGRTSKTFPEGSAPNAAAAAVEPIEVEVQGMPAQVLYAGVQPRYPGLDQMNLQLPAYTQPDGVNTITIRFTAPSAGQTVTYQVGR